MPNNITTSERLDLISQELKELKTISYNELASMMVSDDFYKITFSDRYDSLKDIEYKTVIVWNNSLACTRNEYLAADQDSIKIYRNMIAALRRVGIDPILQLVERSSTDKIVLMCTVKKSVLTLPNDIVDEFSSCVIQFSDSEEDNVACFVGDEMLFFPSYLPSEFESVKSTITSLILNQEPFCLTDLYNRLMNAGYTDKRLILEILNELENNGFIVHKNIVPGNIDNPQYAFVPEGTDPRAVLMRRLGRSIKAFAASRTNEVKK